MLDKLYKCKGKSIKNPNRCRKYKSCKVVHGKKRSYCRKIKNTRKKQKGGGEKFQNIKSYIDNNMSKEEQQKIENFVKDKTNMENIIKILTDTVPKERINSSYIATQEEFNNINKNINDYYLKNQKGGVDTRSSVRECAVCFEPLLHQGQRGHLPAGNSLERNIDMDIIDLNCGNGHQMHRQCFLQFCQSMAENIQSSIDRGILRSNNVELSCPVCRKDIRAACSHIPLFNYVLQRERQPAQLRRQQEEERLIVGRRREVNNMIGEVITPIVGLYFMARTEVGQHIMPFSNEIQVLVPMALTISIGYNIYVSNLLNNLRNQQRGGKKRKLSGGKKTRKHKK